MRIETRQLEVAGLGGHNYLVLVDDKDRIFGEIHGHQNRGDNMLVRESYLPNPPVVGPDNQPVRKIVIEENPEQGFDQDHIRNVWNQMSKNADDLSGKAEYGLLSPNSNSFWATVLQMSGFDPRSVEPESPKWTPGTGIYINDPHWWAPPSRWTGVKLPDERALP